MELNFEYEREYKELYGKFLNIKGFEKYFISVLKENVKFKMSKSGVQLEAEMLFATV